MATWPRNIGTVAAPSRSTSTRHRWGNGRDNEHLVRDIGAFSLALTVMVGAAAVWPERWLVRVALVATGVFAVPHAVFHATHLSGFPPADAMAQTAGIAAQLLLMLGLFVLTWWLPGR